MQSSLTYQTRRFGVAGVPCAGVPCADAAGVTLAPPGDSCVYTVGAGSLRAAMRGLGTRTSDWPRYYRGLGPGVLQKAATRGPMFLASEIGTQCCEAGLGLSREKALVVGSLSSGYVTGFLAASFEWAKVQRSLGATVGSVSARKRLAICHGAGLRNAVFDATFFGYFCR